MGANIQHNYVAIINSLLYLVVVVWLGIRSKGSTDSAVLFVVALFVGRTDCEQGNYLEEPWATNFCPVHYNQTLKSLKQKYE